MTDMFSDLSAWWDALGAGEQIFWSIGIIANALFILYVAFQLIGHDHDLPHIELDHADADFAVLSIRSVLAFCMFLGYTGIVALRAGWSFPIAVLAGVGAGLLAAWLAYRLVRALMRLQTSGNLHIKNAIGQTGTVHLLIPPADKGAGKIMIELQGALREMDAVSEDEAIPTGAPVLVTGVDDENRLVVIPFEQNDYAINFQQSTSIKWDKS